MNNEHFPEITANELRIAVTTNAEDILAGFPYRTGQHFERRQWNTLIIDLEDWSGLTTDQEKFLNVNADVLQYDVWSTVS